MLGKMHPLLSSISIPNFIMKQFNSLYSYKLYKTKISLLKIYYIICCFLICFINYNNNVKVNSININLLHLNDMINIFLINLFIILSLIIISFSGISIIVAIKFIISFGISGEKSGIPVMYYYSASLVHLILELFVLYFIIVITINQISLLIKFFLNKTDIITIKTYYLDLVSKKIPFIIFVLFISAIIEVYVSNRIIYYLASFIT